MWVFGYGSLVWRMDLPFQERRPATLSGFARRFFQQSPDHRGTPEAPGRVVTLVAEEGARLSGVVYRIAEEDREAVLAALDHREKAGYDRLEIEVAAASAEAADGRETLCALIYVGRESNPGFAPGTDDEIAAIVARSVGPSGPNLEYVERLSLALAELGAPDPYVDRIAALARASIAGLPAAPRAVDAPDNAS